MEANLGVVRAASGVIAEGVEAPLVTSVEQEVT